jgi:hypothetical protein
MSIMPWPLPARADRLNGSYTFGTCPILAIERESATGR